jgi:hypothetical protein
VNLLPRLADLLSGSRSGPIFRIFKTLSRFQSFYLSDDYDFYKLFYFISYQIAVFFILYQTANIFISYPVEIFYLCKYCKLLSLSMDCEFLSLLRWLFFYLLPESEFCISFQLANFYYLLPLGEFLSLVWSSTTRKCSLNLSSSRLPDSSCHSLTRPLPLSTHRHKI